MAIIASYNQVHDHGAASNMTQSTYRVVTSLDGSLQATPVPTTRTSAALAVTPEQGCDACPLCSDVCGRENCLSCKDKAWRLKRGVQRSCEPAYTMCEIRRHRTSDSAWLVAGGYVYDATTYIHLHPGGENSILRKCGGVVDCTQDLHFHSARGQKLWKQYRIGRVKKCCPDDDKIWWMFWK